MVAGVVIGGEIEFDDALGRNSSVGQCELLAFQPGHGEERDDGSGVESQASDQESVLPSI
jgi:hypothetical protein